MIVVGDLHLKEKEYFFKAQVNFLNWLNDNYIDENIIMLGDEFDSSTPRWEVFSVFLDFLNKRKGKTYILNGNHTCSKLKGKLLEGIQHLPNVKIFFKEEEFELEGYKCLALPYQYNMDHYNEIKFDGDFVFGHLMIQQEAFGGEYTKIENVKYKYFIDGHIHLKRKYGNIILPGCPVITRNGEENNPVLNIKNNFLIEEIMPPETFKILDIEYGEEIPNKEYLYNIKNAPSIQSVYARYPDYYIREEGITIKRDNIEFAELEDLKSENKSLSEEFMIYSQDKGFDKEVQDCCLTYLEGV